MATFWEVTTNTNDVSVEDSHLLPHQYSSVDESTTCAATITNKNQILKAGRFEQDELNWTNLWCVLYNDVAVWRTSKCCPRTVQL
jgi:hypothetical protein